MELFQLNGKRALVTGATQGIGYAAAKILAAQGAEVWVHGSRDIEKARRAMAETGAAHAVVADFSEHDAADKLYAETGDMDIVISNVSVQIRSDWQSITPEQYELQTDVNLRTTLSLMQKYIPGMQKRHWGRFAAVGSVQQIRPHSQMAVYAASKCAIQSLVENVAKQVAKDGVTINTLLPGVIRTPRNDAALADAAYASKVLEGIPAGFAGEGYDCAFPLLLLCSEEGRYITGASILVDGGMHL